MNPKEKVLYNPVDTGADIINYRVEEAEIDSETGEVVMSTETHSPVWTGKTREWTIKKGELLSFPCYVADYLKKIYGFLEIIPNNKAGKFSKMLETKKEKDALKALASSDLDPVEEDDNAQTDNN